MCLQVRSSASSCGQSSAHEGHDLTGGQQQPGILYSVDVNSMVAIRTAPGKAEERAPLEKGSLGFCVTTFADGFFFQSKVANAFLHFKPSEAEAKAKAAAKGNGVKKVMKKAMKKAMKKVDPTAKALPKGKTKVAPIAKGLAKGQAKVEGKAAAGTCGGKQAYCSEKYCVLWYKRTHLIGIRQKFGATTQIFSFGGHKCNASEAVLRAFADDALKKLDAGMEEGEVANWAKQQVA